MILILQYLRISKIVDCEPTTQKKSWGMPWDLISNQREYYVFHYPLMIWISNIKMSNLESFQLSFNLYHRTARGIIVFQQFIDTMCRPRMWCGTRGRNYQQLCPITTLFYFSWQILLESHKKRKEGRIAT